MVLLRAIESRMSLLRADGWAGFAAAVAAACVPSKPHASSGAAAPRKAAAADLVGIDDVSSLSDEDGAFPR